MSPLPWTAGHLLVATPAIEDGPFHRSVVLMLHHHGDGAQGVILNRPTRAGVDQVISGGWQDVASSPSVIFEGGPVARDTALALAQTSSTGALPAMGQSIFGDIALVDLDSPSPAVLEPEWRLRIFAGYAGWDAGQLEREVREGSWLVVDYHPGDAFGDTADSLWIDVLRRQGGSTAWLALFPPDPSWN